MFFRHWQIWRYPDIALHNPALSLLLSGNRLQPHELTQPVNRFILQLNYVPAGSYLACELWGQSSQFVFELSIFFTPPVGKEQEVCLHLWMEQAHCCLRENKTTHKSFVHFLLFFYLFCFCLHFTIFWWEKQAFQDSVTDRGSWLHKNMYCRWQRWGGRLTTWVYSVMYRTSLIVMKFTRPSASNFLASVRTIFSWWSSACVTQHTIHIMKLSSVKCITEKYVITVCNGVQYLSEERDGVWGDVVLSPHFFHSANGCRDRVNAFCSCNKLIIATALLPLKKKRNKRPGDSYTVRQVNSGADFSFSFQMFPTIFLKPFLMSSPINRKPDLM